LPKRLEKGKEVKVNYAFITTNRVTGQRFFSAAVYHKECWRIVRQKREKDKKKFWILIIVISFFLSVLIFSLVFCKAEK
jgi:hypothetical protein